MQRANCVYQVRDAISICRGDTQQAGRPLEQWMGFREKSELQEGMCPSRAAAKMRDVL